MFGYRPKFGVEIEFLATKNRGMEYVPQREVVDALNAAGIATMYEEYNHHTRSHWKLTTDSSCGFELVSPPLAWEDRHEIHTAMKVLREQGAEINVTCGFHVHHEWPWNQVMSTNQWHDRLMPIVNLYEATEPLLQVLLSPSRFDFNDEAYDEETGENLADAYCRWNNGTLDEYEKYRAVNVSPLYNARPTVEFRQHQGTLNGTKALAWVELTRQIVHAASMPDDLKQGSKFEMVFDRITKPSWNYMVARAAAKGSDITSIINEITNEEN